MRIVMFGFQTWGHRTLQALLESEHEVVGVVTHPQSDHAYERIWSDSVAELAAEHGVDVVLRERPDDDELVDVLNAADPDLIVANNWRTWIPPTVFRLPRLGTLNVHDSLLPAYAGFSPVIWALISGAQEVGVTAHVMNDDLDAGDIVCQRAVPVGPRDTATDLVRATIDLIGPVVDEALQRIVDGVEPTPQDRSQASFFHKRSNRDSRIDWNWPAADIDRLVRAQSDPYPNAYTFHKGQRLYIVQASMSRERYGGTPGRIFIKERDGVVIVAGADARYGRNHGLVVERVRTADGTEYRADEYFRTMGGYLTTEP